MPSTPANKSELRLEDIAQSTRDFLDIRETATDFDRRTLWGARRLRKKSEIHVWWQLLEGIWDGPTDPAEERGQDKKWELAKDEPIRALLSGS